MVSFALSPDGTLLATGAEAHDHADESVEGVILWEVATGKPRWRTLLPGGVGLSDQLRHGLRFSTDGTHLGVNAHTNGVFVLDTATGAVRADHSVTGNDDAPPFVFSRDGGELFIVSTDDPRKNSRALGTIVPAQQRTPPARPEWLATPGAGPVDLVSLDAGALVVLRQGKLIALARPTGQPREIGEVLYSPQRAVAVSRTGLLAAGTDGGEVAVFDPATSSHVAHAQGAPVEALTFGQGARLAIVHQRKKGQPTQASILRDVAPTMLPPALAPVSWFAFADGLPCAPSLDGSEVLLVLPDGAVERWNVTGEPRRTRRLIVVPSASAVVWASATRAIVLGPTVLSFVELPSGKELNRVTFPARR